MAARHPGYLPERLVLAKEEAERQLAEPFRGIATSAGTEAGLFRLGEGGAPTEALRARAAEYLALLSPAERSLGTFPVTSRAWREWSNIHPFFMRHGLLLEELAPAQREAALGLVAEALSEEGYATARDIMRLNETLHELTASDEEYGEWLYWLSLFGEPSQDQPWGFQLDGHHLIVNCLVLGDQVVTTPMFMGSEPVLAPSGAYAGRRVFSAEESLALRLAQGLDEALFRTAQVAARTPAELFSAAYRDNLTLDYEGVAHGALPAGAQRLLMELVGLHVGRTRPPHAAVRLEEIRRHLDRTYFAWMGGREDASVFYYRIHSPVVLVEFDHLPGVAFDNDEPTRNHIHSVVRTPNGNDYGMDLLRQHRELAHATA